MLRTACVLPLPGTPPIVLALPGMRLHCVQDDIDVRAQWGILEVGCVLMHCFHHELALRLHNSSGAAQVTAWWSFFTAAKTTSRSRGIGRRVRTRALCLPSRGGGHGARVRPGAGQPVSSPYSPGLLSLGAGKQLQSRGRKRVRGVLRREDATQVISRRKSRSDSQQPSSGRWASRA
jgi:hypothetical protein